VADFADKSAVGKKLEELRSASSVSGAGGVAAREDEDVAFRIDGYADGLAEMDVGWELQKIGVSGVADFGWLLGESGNGDKQGEKKDEAFHGMQPRDLGISSPHHTRIWEISRLLEICIGLP
jgi:hypothetical protein